MPIYHGGRSTYGEAIGILLLDTKFPRIPGDIGNATTFDFPVRLRVVPGATPKRIVLEGDESMLPDFVEAAKELEAAGVRAITTSCGYLSTFQETLTAAVSVPVFTSSLMQVPMVTRMLAKGKKVGILTIDSRRLNEETLRSAGITDEPVVVMGSEAEETLTAAVSVPVFTSSLMQVPMVTRMLAKGKKVGILTIDSRRLNEETLRSAGITDEPVVVMGSEAVPEFYNTYPRGAVEIDPEKVEGAVIGMVQDLLSRNPDVAAIVCEAINYAPYAAGVQAATGLPWFDIIDLTRHVYNAVVKRRYSGYL